MSEATTAWVTGPLAKRFVRRPLTQAEECEAAALRYEFEKRRSEDVANLFLVGSYILRDASGAGRITRIGHQRAAAAWFEKALAANELDAAERPAVTYLVGELERRTGDHAAAIRHYDAARALSSAPGWLKKMIDEQRRLALRRDDNNDV